MSLHVETTGRGPDLVLLHGWAMHGGVFAPLVEVLRDDFTVHRVDLPGHGLSRDSGIALELEACVDAVAARVPADAAWCGWSLGGLVALQAARRGVPMRALAMLCATPCFVRRPDWPHGMPVDVFRGFADGLRDDWRGTLDRFLALEAFGSDHAREALRNLREALFARGEPAPGVLAEGLAMLEQADLRPALSGLALPAIWISGRRDRLVDPRAMAAAAALMPGAHHHVVEQAGHAPFLTHAGEVARLLRQLREQVP